MKKEKKHAKKKYSTIDSRNIILCNKLNSQIHIQEILQKREDTNLNLRYEVERKHSYILEKEAEIDILEKNLKEDITNCKANHYLSLFNINQMLQNGEKSLEKYDIKIDNQKEIMKRNKKEIESEKHRIEKLRLKKISFSQKQINLTDNEHCNQAVNGQCECKIDAHSTKLNKLADLLNQVNTQTMKTNEEIINLNNKKSDCLNLKAKQKGNIEVLHKRIDSLRKEKIEDGNSSNIADVEQYFQQIERFRKEQIEYYSILSKKQIQAQIIDSQYFQIMNIINTIKNNETVLSLKSNLVKDDIQFVYHNQKEFIKQENMVHPCSIKIIKAMELEKTETIQERVEKLKEIILIKKKNIEMAKRDAELKLKLENYQKEEIYLTKSIKKKSKLIDYYDYCFKSDSNYISFSNKVNINKLRIQADNLSKIHVQHEEEIKERICKFKTISEDLIFQISSQRIRNVELKKEIDMIFKKLKATLTKCHNRILYLQGKIVV